MKMMKQLIKPFQNTTVNYYLIAVLLFTVVVLDQHINSIDAVVRVQLAQRRTRTNDGNDRGA